MSAALKSYVKSTMACLALVGTSVIAVFAAFSFLPRAWAFWPGLLSALIALFGSVLVFVKLVICPAEIEISRIVFRVFLDLSFVGFDRFFESEVRIQLSLFRFFGSRLGRGRRFDVSLIDIAGFDHRIGNAELKIRIGHFRVKLDRTRKCGDGLFVLGIVKKFHSRIIG